MKKRQLSILITSILVGILIIMQGKAFTGVDRAVNRDARADIFREIQLLKTTNDNIGGEVKDLEDQLAKMNGQEEAVQAVGKDIAKYKIVSGQVNVSGPGIGLTVNADIKAIWLTDFVNELISAGAEAVSVNGIRLTDLTDGFDTIPNGQIMLNSVILKAPYKIEAIGDKKTLADSLNQPQGIIQRIKTGVPDAVIELQQNDLVRMEKVI
jgi:uncharacterized protein YlxW (UPF0749 family)